MVYLLQFCSICLVGFLAMEFVMEVDSRHHDPSILNFLIIALGSFD